VIPLVVGLLVLLLFLVRRSPAALVIGGALTGAGIGVLVDREGTQLAGIAFLACVAAGFGVAWIIALLLRVPGLRLWPAVAAAVCGALVAAVAVTGYGEEVRRLAVGWWPTAVIGLGVLLLVGARAGRRRHGPDDDTRPVPIVAAPEVRR